MAMVPRGEDWSQETALWPRKAQSPSNLLDKWKEWDNYNSRAIQSPREGLPSGTDLPRKEWVTLNRARSKVGRTGRNLKRWGLTTSSECKCGNPDQTMEHILRECDGPTCTDLDLEECNEAAKHWIQFWSEKIWWVLVLALIWKLYRLIDLKF